MRERCAALMVLALLLVGCGTEAWERDPAVRAAKQACKGLDEGEAYDCIERRAVESLNPDVCRLTGKWIDDMCLQAVYEAAGDPAICERLYLQGVRPTCRAYYAARLAPPQTPLPPEPLPAFLLEVFPQPAAVVSLDEYADLAWRPGRPSEQQVPQSVCVEIEASSLLARGDFWEAADVQARTTVLIDAGREYQELVTAFVDQGVLHTVVDPTHDPKGTADASVGGPYFICFHAPLTAGVHRVDVSFEKSSGEVACYAWTFELLDRALPIHTQLPMVETTLEQRGRVAADCLGTQGGTCGANPVLAWVRAGAPRRRQDPHRGSPAVTDPIPFCAVVRVWGIQHLSSMPAETQAAFRASLGKEFRVVDHVHYGHLELELGPGLDAVLGGFMNSIWIEQEYVEVVE